jgi:hypothetical protein
MTQLDVLTDALADVLSGKPLPLLPPLPADSESRRFQGRKVATIQQLEELGGKYDAELVPALEKIGIGILRGQTVNAADMVALLRLARNGSPRVAHVAASILCAIDAMKPVVQETANV